MNSLCMIKMFYCLHSTNILPINDAQRVLRVTAVFDHSATYMLYYVDCIVSLFLLFKKGWISFTGIRLGVVWMGSGNKDEWSSIVSSNCCA